MSDFAAFTSTTAGRIRIAGRLEGFAFMPRRELLSTAIETLQADLAASLHRRLEVPHCTFSSETPCRAMG